MKVTHIITGLPVGGAQSMLFNLIAARPAIVEEVISLSDLGTIGERIQELGVPVHALSMNRAFPDPFRLWALVRRLRRSKPNVLQTWMYHADFFGGLAAKLAGTRPIIWNIRQSSFGDQNIRLPMRLTVGACVRVSSWLPDAIVCNSIAAAQIHRDMGYRPDKFVIIPNGIDIRIFTPDPRAGQGLRQELNIPESSFLIGLVGRYHPQKNHAGFIGAAARLCAKNRSAYFILCGEDVDNDNSELVRLINLTGHADRFRLLGIREDMPKVTSGLDLSTSSSSYGEAFSNIIGEAMACAVPCVVTDIGDSGLIVGDTGITVASGDEEGMCRAWQDILGLPLQRRLEMGRRARDRVLEHYSLERAIESYQALYERFTTA